MKKLKFECPYEGVILNDNELTKDEVNELTKQGYLVLSTDDEIEMEDSQTGELLKGKITIVNDDFFLFDCYDDHNKITHEEEMSIFTYLLDLERSGALNMYPRIELYY